MTNWEATTQSPAIVIRRTINPGQLEDRFATPRKWKEKGLEKEVLTSEKERVEDWVWELTINRGSLKGEPLVSAHTDQLMKYISKGGQVLAVINEDKFSKNLLPDTAERIGKLLAYAKSLVSNPDFIREKDARIKELENLLGAKQNEQAKLGSQKAGSREVRS